MANFFPPEGYLYDKNTGLYYSQVIAKNQEGITCQIVTWFNSETGEYSRNIYPVNNGAIQSKTISKEKPKSSEKLERKINTYRNNAGRKTGRRFSPVFQYVLLGIIGALILLILTENITLAFKRHGNNEKKLMESLYESDDKDNTTSVIGESNAEPVEEQSVYSIDGDFTTVWRDTTERGFMGIHYMTVDQDDEYVYTIKAEGENWYETDNIPYGALVRFKKSDIYNVETIISRDNPITAFAVMGDYIYYGQLTADGRCNYTRRNKNTGEELFLLSEDYSLLDTDNGVLYFFFTEDDRNQLGMFDVATGEMSYKEINYDFPAAVEETGKYSLFAPFGLYAGCLCIGGHIGDNTIFWSMVDLNTDEIKQAKCRNKFLGASLAKEEATAETARYYRRYGMGAMFGPGEKNPFAVKECETNGIIKLFNYRSDLHPDVVSALDKFGSAESERYNRLELDFYDLFTGERPESGKYGYGFRLKFDEYPEMALSFDNYPTGIIDDFYIYNNYIFRLEGTHITEIAEY